MRNPRRVFSCLFFLLGACETTKPDANAVLVRPMFQKGFVSLEAAPSKEEIARFKSNSLLVPAGKSYQPNYPGAIGLGVGAFGLSVSYATAFRPEDDQREEKGTTNAHDLQLHFTFRSIGVDATEQRFEGFYEEGDDLDAGASTIHPDLEMERSAINLFWMSDPESFAFDAAFGQSRYSEKSGGSLLAMLSVDESKVDHMPASLTADLSSAPVISLQALETRTVGLLGGIGMRGVLTGMGPLSGAFGGIAVLVGPGWQESTWRFADGSTQTITDKQVLKTNARFSMGIDKGHWFVGGGFWGDTSSAHGETIDLKLASNQIESFCGMRF